MYRNQNASARMHWQPKLASPKNRRRTMWKRNLLILAILSLTVVSTAQAQREPDPDAKIAATHKQPRVKPKAKTVTTNNAHDRYANQEVSYRKSDGNDGAKSRKKTTNVWGDPHVNERSNAKTTNPKPKPTSQIFMEGGNDSWNTRKKPARRKSSINKLKSDGNEVAIESLERKSQKTAVFDEADALFGKNHERPNQIVFEPNNEPLWANVKRTTKRQRANVSKRQ